MTTHQQMIMKEMIMTPAIKPERHTDDGDRGADGLIDRLEDLYRRAGDSSMTTTVLLDFLDGIEMLLRDSGRPQLGTPLSETVRTEFGMVEYYDDDYDDDGDLGEDEAGRGSDQ